MEWLRSKSFNELGLLCGPEHKLMLLSLPGKMDVSEKSWHVLERIALDESKVLPLRKYVECVQCEWCHLLVKSNYVTLLVECWWKLVCPVEFIYRFDHVLLITIVAISRFFWVTKWSLLSRRRRASASSSFFLLKRLFLSKRGRNWLSASLRRFSWSKKNNNKTA